MSDKSLFDFSDLAIESIDVRSGDSIERIDEGHGITELAGSSHACGCACFCHSPPSFVAEDDLG